MATRTTTTAAVLVQRKLTAPHGDVPRFRLRAGVEAAAQVHVLLPEPVVRGGLRGRAPRLRVQTERPGLVAAQKQKDRPASERRRQTAGGDVGLDRQHSRTPRDQRANIRGNWENGVRHWNDGGGGIARVKEKLKLLQCCKIKLFQA